MICKRFLFLGLLLAGFAVGAKAVETLSFRQQHSPGEAGFHYFYWIDSNDVGIRQALEADKRGAFAPYTGPPPFYLGYVTNTFWLRLRVQNMDTLPVDIFWNVFRDVDSLSLFELNDSGTVLMEHPFRSFKTPIHERPLQVRSVSFEINLKPQEAKQLYLRVVHKGDIIQVPMSLTTETEFYQSELPFYLLYGVFFGIYFFTIFGNLILYTFLRDSLYLWYGAYIVAIMLFVSMDDYLEGYLLPLPLFHAMNAAGRLVAIFFIFTTQMGLAKRIIELSPDNSRFYYVMNKIVYSLPICALLTTVINMNRYHIPFATQRILFGIAIVIAGITISLFIIIMVEQIWKRNQMAIYYALCNFIVFITINNYYLQLFNLSFSNRLLKSGLPIGLTLEIVGLAILMGYRFYLLNKEKLGLIKENAVKQEQLTVAVVQAHEEEQANIARDLHDGPLSYMMAMRMMVNQKLHQFGKRKQDQEAEETLLEIQTRLDKTIRDVREVSHHLMPKEMNDSTLTEIIRSHLQTVEYTSHIRFEFMANEAIHNLPKSTQLHLYRMVSELVTNIVRHSQASEASIQLLLVDGNIQLLVEDNGIGINTDANSQGIGLKNIRTRVQLLKGKINIDSSNRGTVLIIEIPKP